MADRPMLTRATLAKLPDPDLLARLEANTAELRDADRRVKDLQGERLSIWLEARRRVPPIKIAVLAAASKLAEVSVNKMMRKGRAAKNGSAK